MRNIIIKTINACLSNMFYFCPIKKNKIVMNNFSGSSFGDNPKYIALQLLKMKSNLDIVWITKDLSIKVPKGIRLVKNHSLKSAYELSTARVWIFNVRNAFKTRKKKSQFYIQTWHGEVDVKKVEGQVIDRLGRDYIKDAKRDGKVTDLMISNGTYTTMRFNKWYWYNGRVLESGYPRMDILINKPSSVKSKVYDYFHLRDKNMGIVVYAPTFRDITMDMKNPLAVYTFNYDRILDKLEEKFNKQFVMLLRLHPNIQKWGYKLRTNNRVLNATDYEDMQELLSSADVLITDYSSCMFDFILAKKPAFIFTKDYCKYKNNERGFNFDITKLPALFSQNENELCNNIGIFDNKNYVDRCKTFCSDLGIHENGKASAEVAKEIIKVINS